MTFNNRLTFHLLQVLLFYQEPQMTATYSLTHLSLQDVHELKQFKISDGTGISRHQFANQSIF